MTNLIDILIFSVVAALATYFHNGLYEYNKTLLVVICGILFESLFYRVCPIGLYAELHVGFIIVMVWLLIIYTFYLKYNSNQYKCGKKNCRRSNDKNIFN